MNDDDYESLVSDLPTVPNVWGSDWRIKLPWWKRWLRKRFYTPREILWPSYECKQCVGQERWQGCYCQYYQAWDVDWPYPPLWARIGRAIWRWWTGKEKLW